MSPPCTAKSLMPPLWFEVTKTQLFGAGLSLSLSRARALSLKDRKFMGHRSRFTSLDSRIALFHTRVCSPWLIQEFVLLPKLACASPVAFLFAFCVELSFHFMLLVWSQEKKISNLHHERSACGVRTGKAGSKIEGGGERVRASRRGREGERGNSQNGRGAQSQISQFSRKVSSMCVCVCGCVCVCVCVYVCVCVWQDRLAALKMQITGG
jgi:hypothetical protein